ncbi:MAG TPA: beta-hydroxyacyl-ACP dehydratase, partial [Trinickia sp.]|nr:beta-hydroxyacyl-ACP dehydratase [Trinickia sp.]
IGKALERPLDACKISSAKFPSPARPGEPLALTCRMNENGAIHFTVRTGTRTVATGTLTERQLA